MARVFSAVDLRDEEVLRQLEQVRDTLDLGFSKVPRRKMHLTLQFFEDVSPEQVEKVEETLEAIETEPFRMELKGIGAFPSEDYIRVVWAGVDSHRIFDLQKQAEVHDVPSDDRNEFKPHVTLLRVSDISTKRKKKLQRMIKERRGDRIAEVEVDSVTLFESRLTGNGSVYEKISEVEL